MQERISMVDYPDRRTITWVDDAEPGVIIGRCDYLRATLARESAEDMLALLIELVDIEGPLPGTSKWGDKARATIAEAEGRS